ncbi:M15 family metallopeptidase [Cellulomonas fimi]|uniref:M15 family metallopeptidase n=1 Tax=Cellulomonas fimi TaxID=1708 RepID=UPI00234C3F46|nr:M15 family metallopeptidase [Cellulomonas fimi]MDC7120326.1 M15 family metallopeptidase [Cellulomonas fimi]
MAAVVLVGGGAGAWAHVDRRERERDEQAAVVRVDDAVGSWDGDVSLWGASDAAVGRAVTVTTRDAAGAALAAVAEQARSTLAATEGKVEDDAVRQALAAVLAEADAASAAPGASVATARRVAASLAAADATVAQAHTQWQQAQDAAAARAARPAAPSGGSASGSGPGGGKAPPSCETTYNGPPFYTSPATDGGDGSNGKLPPSALTAVSWDVDPRGTPYYLRNDATAALERLNVAFRARFGHDLDLDLTYRDYATQVAMREALGTVAAVPGTSSHGTGLAMDVPELPCEYGWGTPQRDWLVANGPSYGWVVPSWARQNGSNPEYWHFEYRG